jgi:30S ribosomal protein 3
MCFSFRLIWRENSLGIALDQSYKNNSFPLTSYYYWPKNDAWSQLRLDLKTKTWISPEEQTFLLNTTSDILNHWQASAKQSGIPVFSYKNCLVKIVGTF